MGTLYTGLVSMQFPIHKRFEVQGDHVVDDQLIHGTNCCVGGPVVWPHRFAPALLSPAPVVLSNEKAPMMATVTAMVLEVRMDDSQARYFLT